MVIEFIWSNTVKVSELNCTRINWGMDILQKAHLHQTFEVFVLISSDHRSTILCIVTLKYV